MFSLEYCKIFRNSYFVQHLWRLLKCRVMTLKRVKVASAVFLRGSFRKLFLNYWSAGRRISTVESNLSKVAQQGYRSHCCLLEILQEFRKIVLIQERLLNNCFSSLQVTQKRLWWDCDFFFLLFLTEYQLLKIS